MYLSNHLDKYDFIVLTKNEPKPQLEQPCHRLLPSKLFILENRPKWLLTITFGDFK